MPFLRHFNTLLCKSLRLKWRSRIVTTCELLLPPIFVLLMVAIYGVFETENIATASFVNKRVDVVPFSSLPYRLSRLGWGVGVAAASSDPALLQARDNFVSWMDNTHAPLNGSQVPFFTAEMQAVSVPKPSAVMRKFDSAAAFGDYVASPDYGIKPDYPRLHSCIVFTKAAPDWEYSIRMNFTDTPNTFRAVNTLQRDVDLGSMTEYARFSPAFQPASPPTQYDGLPMPGFLTMQLEVDRFILNSSVPSLTIADISVPAFAERVLGGVAATMPQLAGETAAIGAALLDPSKTAQATQVVNSLLDWLGSERFAPHRLSLTAFPIVGFETNGFYGIVQNLFPFFFVLCELFPVAMLLRGIVQEKEAKLRESLKMMGVNTAALTYSWVAQYTILFLVQSLLVTLIGSGSLFKSSGFAAPFLLFLLFGLSSVAFIVLIAVFFSRTKTATIVGVLLFLALYFVYTATSADEISFDSKLASAFAAPTAFSLGIKTLALYEDQGVGVQLGVNSGANIRNWSFDASLYMMAIDTLLYLLLAWYCDEVLPASLREFGVPRPWYFPVSASYWREVLGYEAAVEHDNVPGIFDGKDFVPAGADHKLFEKPSADLLARGADEKCVAIRGLRREFGRFVAVKDIDLDCFENQITVILGHNGAGKSTTFNMLTGMLPATAGGGHVYGKSMRSQMSEIRGSLGVCPQHDVLWPDLTVLEHLRLFAEVKDMELSTIAPAIEEAISRVGLTEKRNVLSKELSGGQKRKLSVAIALLGDPKLVILDEPTSGMDPYSRRATWDMLRTAREGRTTILTTHFLDEADLLGDRIAIMSHGDVKCCGSPLFLKSKLGAGYEMTVVKRQMNADSEYGCDSQAIIDTILRRVPVARVASNIGAEMRVNLPFSASSSFPGLFDDFDEDMALPQPDQKLGILTYGVSVTSIESVFLAVASDEFDKLAAAAVEDHPGDTTTTGDASAAASAANTTKVSVTPPPAFVDKGAASAAAVTPSVMDKELMDTDPEDGGIAHATLEDVRGRARRDEFTCCGRFWVHFYALLCKRYAFQKRDFRFVCCSILLPGILVIVGLALLINGQLTSWPSLKISTAEFNRKRVDGVWTNLPNRVPFLGFDAGEYPPVANPFPASVVSSTAMPNTTGEAITASTPIDPQPFGFFNASASPADGGPATKHQLQRLSTWLLQHRSDYEASRYGSVALTQEVYNPSGVPSLSAAPEAVLLVNTTGRHAPAVFTNLLAVALAKAGLNPSVSSITVTNDPLPFTASQSLIFGQFSSLSAALIIVIAFAFVSLAPISFIVRERETSAKHQQQLAGVSIPSYWLSSFLWDVVSYIIPFAITVIAAFAYDIKEFTSSEGDAVSAFLVLMFMHGLCATAFAYFVGHFFSSHTGAQVALQLAGVVSLVLVIASFVMSFIADTCEADKSLRFVYRLLPGFALGNGLLQLSFLSTLPFLEAICNGGAVDPTKTYNAWDLGAAGYSILYLGVLSVVYLSLAILIDVYRNNPSAQNCFRVGSAAAEEPPKDTDDDVERERARIQNGSDRDLKDDVVVLDRLTKTYPGGKKAVRGLSFGVKVGQVFGFLGINGAGKTSTLKMLSGDLLPSPGGSAKIAGYDILAQQDRVRRLLGYCPQFDALLDLVTVREHLSLFARIKGVPEGEIPGIVSEKMEEMGLTEYADRVASALSGGNRRKLSMAIALVSEPPVVFADEPSTGMDPKARRGMWKIILRIARSKGTSVVLTSHSMEEVEALCSRVGIMVGGRLRCLGSIQHLKNKFGRGWMVEVRQKATTPAEVEAMCGKAREAGAVRRVGGDSEHAEECVVSSSLLSLFGALGHPEWTEEVHPKRSAWMVHDAIASRPGNDVPLSILAPWVAEQTRAQDLEDFVTKEAFKPDGDEHPRLIERHGLKFRFRVPPQSGTSLGDMFRAMEAGKAPHSIADYSIGQTSLEQVFNQFAADQDEEQGEVAGLVQEVAHKQESKRVESPLAAAASKTSPA